MLKKVNPTGIECDMTVEQWVNKIKDNDGNHLFYNFSSTLAESLHYVFTICRKRIVTYSLPKAQITQIDDFIVGSSRIEWPFHYKSPMSDMVNDYRLMKPHEAESDAFLGPKLSFCHFSFCLRFFFCFTIVCHFSFVSRLFAIFVLFAE